MPLPRAYVINLDRSTDRMARFRERNGHLEHFSRFPAVDGAAVQRSDLEGAGYITRELDYTRGAVGCAMSHVKLWEKAVADCQAITVFEDDAILSQRFDRCADRVIATLPVDWDFIVWGNNFPRGYVWVDLSGPKGRIQPYGDFAWLTEKGAREFQLAPFSGGAVRLLHAFGTNAYSASVGGARRALDYCLPLRSRMIAFPEADVVTKDTGIDIALCGLYPSMKAFVCLPPLAITMKGAELSVKDQIT